MNDYFYSIEMLVRMAMFASYLQEGPEAWLPVGLANEENQ